MECVHCRLHCFHTFHIVIWIIRLLFNCCHASALWTIQVNEPASFRLTVRSELLRMAEIMIMFYLKSWSQVTCVVKWTSLTILKVATPNRFAHVIQIFMFADSRCGLCAGSDERHCCQVDCYTLADCKQAFSANCTSAPVECAMGITVLLIFRFSAVSAYRLACCIPFYTYPALWLSSQRVL